MPNNIHGFSPTVGSLQSTGQQTTKKTGIYTLADFQDSPPPFPVPPLQSTFRHNNMRVDTCSSYSFDANRNRLSKLKAENEKALAKIAELGADVDRLAEETNQLMIQSSLSRWSKNMWSYLSSVGSWVQQKISQLIKWLCSSFKK